MKATILAVLLALAGGAYADEHHHDHAAAPANPSFDKLKSLVGNWEGTAEEGGKQVNKSAKTEFHMVSGNSVLMNTLAAGTPMEMITMIHMDLKDVVATHYCAGQNQPRFKMLPSAKPNELTFEFKDGTNIGPNDGHMQRVVFTFVDDDHHTEDWVYLDKGKESTMRFDFHRKK